MFRDNKPSGKQTRAKENMSRYNRTGRGNKDKIEKKSNCT